MRRLALLLALPLLLSPAFASETKLTVQLMPDEATLALRAYALGLMPVTVHVRRFAGTLTYDPANPAHCTVRMTAEVASVETANANTRETLLGPEFLDAARFPTLSFTGACATRDAIAGDLTLRGVTRRLDLTLDWRRHLLIAHGELRRGDWGMSARPFVVGPTIGIRMAANLP